MEKANLEDIKLVIKKMNGLNGLLFDSVVHNNCECYYKYKYVANEMSKFIWELMEYFDIE